MFLVGLKKVAFRSAIGYKLLGETWHLVHNRNDGANPVLDFSDVNDYGECQYIADPFLITGNGNINMFFEIYNPNKDPDAVIGHAVFHEKKESWEYNQVVLNTGKHLSFPFVFCHGSDYYMIPEEGGKGDKTVNLYKSSNFPIEWEKEKTMLKTDHLVGDTIVFKWKSDWWLLCGHQDGGLYAYYNQNENFTAGNWEPHNKNPIKNSDQLSRPAGRPMVFDDSIVLFLQDCEDVYGKKVFAYEVEYLEYNKYSDKKLTQSAIIEAEGRLGWNSARMHHIDPFHTEEGWIYAVDGNSKGRGILGDRWSIGIYDKLDILDRTPSQPSNEC